MSLPNSIVNHSDENPELERLMHLSRQGDQEAFAQFFELRRDMLAREVRRKIGNQLQQRIDASDVLQDVFLQANRRLNEVADNDVPLLAWLRVLLNQRVVDMMRTHLKASKRSLSREKPLAGERSEVDLLAEQLVAAITSPSMQVHRCDLQQRVRQLLDELSPLDREILLMRHYRGMSNGEVAKELELSINAASNRYVRALKRFKSVLESFESL